MHLYPPFLNVVIRHWINILLDQNLDLRKGQFLELPKYFLNGQRKSLWLKLTKVENSTTTYCIDLCSSTFTITLLKINEFYPIEKLSGHQQYFKNYYENRMEEIAYEFDFANKIVENLGEIEILHSYNNPLNYHDFFTQVYTLESNIPPTFNNNEHINEWIVLSEFYRKKDEPKVDFTIEEILKRNAFIKLLDVKIVEITEYSSTRRRDSWKSSKNYCIYYRGMRIDDGYLNSILPETEIKYYSEYNDSTPGKFGTEKSYMNSKLETERFLSKYDIHSHLRFLGPHFETDFLIYKKLDKQTVYHEFGHLFGLCVSNSLGHFVTDIANINLVYDYQNPGLTLKNNPFTHKKDLTSSQKMSEIQRIQLELKKDITQVLYYILYLVSGAVFNIFYFKRKPIIEDFHIIFLDDDKAIKYSMPDARAGNDFTKINNLKWDLEWGQFEFSNFKFFALELFYVLDKNFIFNEIENEDLFNFFDENFNGKITSGKDVQVSSLNENINKILNKPGLLTDIEILIDKYLHKIKQQTI